MITKASYAPTNSLIVISGVGKIDAPDWIRDAQVVATKSCILCASFPEIDGETEILFSNVSEVGRDDEPVFDGLLEMRSHDLSLRTVEGDPIITATMPSRIVGIRIWLSHPVWPELVTVGWYMPADQR